MQTQFLNTAVELGDTIISLAKRSDNGWCWEYCDDEGVISINQNLYNGSSGTLFFLIELYKVTQDDKYLAAAKEGARDLMNNDYDKEKYNLALYCGIGGVILVLIELNKITGEEMYLNYIRHSFLSRDIHNNNSELLYGTAGTILTLLHLHNHTGWPDVLDIIFDKIKILLNELIVFGKGICWDYSGNVMHPLCGFAHGNSGIAFLFVELSRYFNDPIYIDIAEMAFEYENYHYNSTQNNWADLRVDMYSEEKFHNLIQSFRNNEYTNKYKPNFMSAWCHGAPGIGMVRLAAYKHSMRENFLLQYRNAMNNTIKSLDSETKNYTLCHGKFGNADFLLESYLVFNEVYMYSICQKIAKEAIDDYKLRGYFISGVSKTSARANCDLLNGLAGIGHFFLRVNDPVNVSSILLPAIRYTNDIKQYNNRMEYTYILNILYNKIYNNTSNIVQFNHISKYFNKEIISIHAILDYVDDYLSKSQDENIHKSYLLDIKIQKIKYSIKCVNYFYIKKYVEINNIKDIVVDSYNFTDISRLKLRLNSTIFLSIRKMSLLSIYDALVISTNNNYVEQFIIGEFAYNLLSIFKEGCYVETVLHNVREIYFEKNIGISLEKILFKEISHFLLQNWLVIEE